MQQSYDQLKLKFYVGQTNQVIGVNITVNSATHATITWHAIPEAVKYQVALHEDGRATIQDISNGAMRFEFTNAKSGTTYIVNVRAVFANDKVGNWSTSGTLLTRKNCYSYSC